MIIINKICIYLRKSRADEELEKTLGEGETLRKHKDTLLKFAKEKKLNIVEIKEEIVSGDSLFFRPKMLELLKEIEQDMYKGVLCMDIDRLGRGGMKDQGTIIEAFKEHNTLIITPGKTYDLNNEYDEEMTEFKTFFARRELKTITKRMQGGRVRSVEDGNYIATNPPYGYDIRFIGKSRTLKINESESEIIKIIFNMYSDGNGATAISSYLNSIGTKTKLGNNFSPSSVLVILKNPVYIGKISWKKREEKKSKIPGKTKDCRTRDKKEWIISQGKHEPIISENLFNRCQTILNERYHIPYQLHNKPINPFSGLITCKICEKKMTMRPSRGINRIMCTHKCGNKSIRFDYVEKGLLKELEDYLNQYKFEVSNKSTKNSVEILKKQEIHLSKELTTLTNQKLKLFDFLERGLYNEDTFLDRSKNLDSRINTIKKEKEKIDDLIRKDSNYSNESDLQLFESVISAYKSTDDVVLKNQLLKSILDKIEYLKSPEQKNNEFKIILYHKLLR